MEEKQLDVKQRILQAAKKLFSEKGFDGTTVREICEEAASNIASLSYYFGGKENVFLALFDTYFPSHKLKDYEELSKDPVEALTFLIREVILFRLQDPQMAIILQQEIVMRSPRIEGIRIYILPVWVMLRELLEDGKNMGIFHFRSLDQTMFFVIATIIFPRHSPFLDPLLTEEVPDKDLVIQDTIEFVKNGLGYV